MRMLAALLALALWLAAAAGSAMAQSAASPSAARQPPACTGRDLYAGMAEQDPAARARIDAAGSATLNAGAILWRVSREGRPTSHLFGTVHLTDARVTALSQATRQAMAAAEQIVLEVADLSPAALEAAVGRMQGLLVQSEGRSLVQDLTPGQAEIARQALERAGIPGGAIELLRPWVVTMTLALTECERKRASVGIEALDAAIGSMARQRGAPVLGLETLDDQLTALAAVPDEDQLTVLRATLELNSINEDLTETLVRLYLARRLGQIWPLQIELWRRAGYPVDALASFQRELLTKRNIGMAGAAAGLIEARPSFIAVGALHLPGEHGLVELLRRAGWTVESVE